MLTRVDLVLQFQQLGGRTLLNGVPIGNVPVQLFSEPSGTLVASTTSASDGSYGFNDLPLGRYRLHAAARGDATDVLVTLTTRGQDVSVDLNLFLETISGRVTVNGVPTGGITVELLSSASTTPIATQVTASKAPIPSATCCRERTTCAPARAVTSSPSKSA